MTSFLKDEEIAEIRQQLKVGERGKFDGLVAELRVARERLGPAGYRIISAVALLCIYLHKIKRLSFVGPDTADRREAIHAIACEAIKFVEEDAPVIRV